MMRSPFDSPLMETMYEEPLTRSHMEFEARPRHDEFRLPERFRDRVPTAIKAPKKARKPRTVTIEQALAATERENKRAMTDLRMTGREKGYEAENRWRHEMDDRRREVAIRVYGELTLAERTKLGVEWCRCGKVIGRNNPCFGGSYSNPGQASKGDGAEALIKLVSLMSRFGPPGGSFGRGPFG